MSTKISTVSCWWPHLQWLIRFDLQFAWFLHYVYFKNVPTTNLYLPTIECPVVAAKLLQQLQSRIRKSKYQRKKVRFWYASNFYRSKEQYDGKKTAVNCKQTNWGASCECGFGFWLRLFMFSFFSTILAMWSIGGPVNILSIHNWPTLRPLLLVYGVHVGLEVRKKFFLYKSVNMMWKTTDCNLVKWTSSFWSMYLSPHRTPSVNQYWAIVNSSLPCNIFCSLSRLKFASFKRILTVQKLTGQQS